MSSVYIRWPQVLGGGGGVPVYPNAAALPGSASSGSLAVADDTGDVYEFHSGTWVVVGGPGVILGVTATSPLFSSGGATPNLTIQQSSGSQAGYLSAADWSTFNNKQPAGAYITALTGDVVATGPGSVPGTIQPNAVTNPKLAQMATLTIKGNNTGSTANASDLTVAQVNAILPVFTATLKGLTPISGGGTVNFLRADGTWVNPVAGYANQALSNLTSTAINQDLLPDTTDIRNLGSSSSLEWNELFVQHVSASADVAAPNGYYDSLNPNSGSLINVTAPFDMGTSKIQGLGNPTLAQDAATKNYVDTVASQLQPIQAVSAASTATITGTYVNGASGIGATFTTTSTSTFTLDGYTPTLGQRILLKNQSSGFQNGVYNITQLATGVLPAILTRSLDYDTSADIGAGNLVPVINGTANTQTSWLQTATVTTVGTDPLVFAQWTANPSSYLLKANNLSDVVSKSSSFNNLSPMTTTGDLILGGTSGAGTRLPVGSNGQYMRVVSGTPAWTTVTPGIVRSQVRTSAAFASSTGFAINFTTLISTVGSNITYSSNATTGDTWTINVDGVYSMDFLIGQTSNDAGIVVNGNPALSLNSQTNANILNKFETGGTQFNTCSYTGIFTAGDVVQAYATGTIVDHTDQFGRFNICQVSN